MAASYSHQLLPYSSQSLKLNNGRDVPSQENKHRLNLSLPGAGFQLGRSLTSSRPLPELFCFARQQMWRQLPARMSVVRAMAEIDTDTSVDLNKGRDLQKVRVVLGPYKAQAISVSGIKYEVSEAEIEKDLKAKLERTYAIDRVNFTGSGAKLGHTVKVNFEGKYVEGPMAGQVIKGTKASMFELELKARDDEPWKTIVEEIVKAGMGQEESKTFEVRFPDNYKAKPLAGLKARFTVTVKEIGVKRELEVDPRPVSEKRAEIEAQLKAAAEKRTNEGLDAKIREAIIATSVADVEKVAASVSWAKFGERSLNDFRWNVLQEEIGRVEGIPFDQVPAFLRSEAKITYLKE